jgi:hypothetical protein
LVGGHHHPTHLLQSDGQHLPLGSVLDGLSGRHPSSLPVLHFDQRFESILNRRSRGPPATLSLSGTGDAD